MKPDTSFVLKSGHFYLLTTLPFRRHYRFDATYGLATYGLATTQPELLFNGMLGNALDIPGIGLCTPIWAIFPPPVLLLDCLILKLHVHKVRLIHRDVAH